MVVMNMTLKETFYTFYTRASLKSRINLGFIVIVFGATIVNEVLSIIQTVTTTEQGY